MDNLNVKKESDPLVSVVIPFYNNTEWLREAVDSVLNQTYSNFEIILVNDGSPEDISGFLSEYGEKITYLFKQNEGPASARNLGIEKAAGEYIAFLDSDDLWLPDKLKIQIGKMIEYGAMWSCCSYETFGDNNPRRIFVSEATKMLSDSYSKRIATPSVVIKADVLKANTDLRFNKSIRYGEDFYLWMLLILSYPILSIHDILVKVRMRGSNAGKRAYAQIKARADLWKLRKENAVLFQYNKNVPLDFKLASEMCIAGCALLRLIERCTSSKKVLEYAARVLYVLPYIIFKCRKMAI
jgi:glycosyltransferase involved in cell wall biosynthesis